MTEFQLIRQIQRETSVAASTDPDNGVRLGIGDDAAVVAVQDDEHLVVATDTLNAGVHFPEDTSPFAIGYKCLAVNLSDLAAMGAVPRWAVLSLSMPKADPDWLRSFNSGFRTLAQEFGVVLVGGDTTCGPLSVGLTVLGVIERGRQLQRNGAKPGDLVVVSGTVGGAARVLDLLQTKQVVGERNLLDHPQPRVRLGRALVGYANACIDVSDGLLADLGHILEASRCGAQLELEKLPEAGLLAKLEDESKWRYQLAGGDDYELLFSLPPSHEDMLRTWSRDLDTRLSVIGRVTEGDGILCMGPQGDEFYPQSVGFEHFRRKP